MRRSSKILASEISANEKADVILGFDPGLRATGWGVIRLVRGGGVAHIASGTITPDANRPIAEKLFFLEQKADEVMAAYRPASAGIEKAFVGASISAAFLLGQARAACLIAAARADVPITEYAPTKIKKAMTGSGRADKHQIGFMVRRLLPAAQPDSEHAADALAIALCHAWRDSSALRAAS